jgi:adenine-specific DNA-methyltransferase
MIQTELFDIEKVSKFPTTRYQGSKLKYIDWIWHCIKDLKFNTVLDAFGGTGSVAYKFKKESKQVTYNDILEFNYLIGKGLIENDCETISSSDLEFILNRHNDVAYDTFIEDTFVDVYFTDEENRWLDTVIANINLLENEYKRAIALFALFQSCIIKRPYNLFHRKNLYIRTQEVKRSFGNKVTWDTSFDVHFKNFIKEANNAIFSNGKTNKSINSDIFCVKNDFDLIYIDTPYVSANGVGVDYLDFYHFLEGMVNYKDWDNMIEYKTKHKRLKLNGSEWAKSSKIEQSFEKLINQFKDSILVISYRSDGFPSVERIKEILILNGKNVEIYESREMKYVLSKKQSSEVLIIGK